VPYAEPAKGGEVDDTAEGFQSPNDSMAQSPDDPIKKMVSAFESFWFELEN
jgi:hypothetical protein